jgi:hypothetical protein
MVASIIQEPIGERAEEPSRIQGIPRLVYLGRILQLCFFPLATVALGDIAVCLVPQAQEALLAFGDGSRFVSQVICFELGYVAWMISAWYVARLLVGKRFEPDLVGVCCSPRFARGVTKYLPRVLAVVAGLPVAVYQIFFSHVHFVQWLGVGSLALCAAVLVGLVFRRSWGRRHHHRWVQYWSRRAHEADERFDRLSGAARLFIGALFAISFGVFLALPLGLEQVARPLGAAALLMFALMSWNIFGGFILTYWPKLHHWPSLVWVAGVFLLAFHPLNENHPVAPPSAVVNPPLVDLSDLFRQWLQRRADPEAPVIFVSSAGGASRAAYWTTSALGKLEDEARAHSQLFSGNVFVISGVSGGSLGAASFVTALDLVGEGAGKSDDCAHVRRVANSFTGEDHLATVVGMMLFPDLVQRFLPFSYGKLDRSRGLEEVWASDWQQVADRCGAPGAPRSNPWSDAFGALYTRNPRSLLPALALNTTALAAGQPVMQANFRLGRSDSFDLLGCAFATRSLTLAQAVHNSARFPYISPAGVVRQTAGEPGSCVAGTGVGPVWDRLGDGGYVEASGTLSLAQIIQALIEAGLIRDSQTDGIANTAAPDAGRSYITADQVRVLVLDNAPTNGNSYLCEARGPGQKVDATRAWHAQNIIQSASGFVPPGPDFLAPLVGSFSTRGGRGVTAEVDLKGLVGGCTSRFAELRLPKSTTEREPSMNWMLNTASRAQIDAALDNPTMPGGATGPVNPYVLLHQNLDLVRSWFSAAAAPGARE